MAISHAMRWAAARCGLSRVRTLSTARRTLCASVSSGVSTIAAPARPHAAAFWNWSAPCGTRTSGRPAPSAARVVPDPPWHTTTSVTSSSGASGNHRSTYTFGERAHHRRFERLREAVPHGRHVALSCDDRTSRLERRMDDDCRMELLCDAADLRKQRGGEHAAEHRRPEHGPRAVRGRDGGFGERPPGRFHRRRADDTLLEPGLGDAGCDIRARGDEKLVPPILQHTRDGDERQEHTLHRRRGPQDLHRISLRGSRCTTGTIGPSIARRTVCCTTQAPNHALAARGSSGLAPVARRCRRVARFARRRRPRSTQMPKYVIIADHGGR